MVTPFSHTLRGNFENLVLSGTDNVTGTGNDLDNVITGNDGANRLFGDAGADTLYGGAGADTLNGEKGGASCRAAPATAALAWTTRSTR